MRRLLLSPLTLIVVLGFAAPARAEDKPKLEIMDPGLPLYETRPLDRRVWVLTLDGTWNVPPVARRPYYINVLFPNGKSYSHRVDEDVNNHQQVRMEVGRDGRLEQRIVEKSPFRRGEVRVVLQDYQLTRNGLNKGGNFTVVVSSGKAVTSDTAEEVVSNPLKVDWPMERPVSPRLPRTRHQDPPPVDRFPLPGEGPEYEPIPAPKPAEPDDRADTE